MSELVSEPTNELEMRDAIVALLREVRHDRNAWDGAVNTLRGYLEGTLKSVAREVLADSARRERLELQWKLEEVLEQTAPPAAKKEEPEAEEEEEAEEPADGRVLTPLRPEDLVQIYDDPRGLMIHRHKTDGRWLLTQVDPNTGQPQTVELADHHKTQIKQELEGSPYWLEKSWD